MIMLNVFWLYRTKTLEFFQPQSQKTSLREETHIPERQQFQGYLQRKQKTGIKENTLFFSPLDFLNWISEKTFWWQWNRNPQMTHCSPLTCFCSNQITLRAVSLQEEKPRNVTFSFPIEVMSSEFLWCYRQWLLELTQPDLVTERKFNKFWWAILQTYVTGIQFDFFYYFFFSWKKSLKSDVSFSWFYVTEIFLLGYEINVICNESWSSAFTMVLNRNIFLTSSTRCSLPVEYIKRKELLACLF